MKTYDVIIIGAGNGGLAAAATCAKAGLSTLLLERHNLPGGAASSFVRGRFEFEPSLHELSGVGAPDEMGSIDQIFNDLGVKIPLHKHDSTFRLVVPAKDGDTDAFVNENGVKVTVDARMPSGFDSFARKLDELVPGSYKPCMDAFELSTFMYKGFPYLLNFKNPINLMKAIPWVPNLMKMSSHNVTEGLTALGMPKKAQDIFNSYWCYMGSPAAQFDFMFYMVVVHAFAHKGTGVPENRSHEMSLAIEKIARDNGADIWYNSEVTKVIMRNGKPAGVVINGNKEVYGTHFICNSSPTKVWTELFEQKDIPKKQLKMLNERKNAGVLTTVYLGMNKTAEELGIKDYSVFISPEADSDKQFALCDDYGSGYCIINCLNTIIPDCTPPGTSSLFLTSLTFGDVMRDVKPENYKKYKTKIAKDMIETCEKALNIEITPYIEEIEIALPPTFARYLNTPLGTPYGYMLEKWDSMVPRTMEFDFDQPFSNFLFCGASQERGDGYGCAYFTGQKAANEIIKKVRRGK